MDGGVLAARRAPRVAVPLRHHFSERLTGYAAVAGATGVGLLAAVTPAQAGIIYTPTHVTFTSGSSLNLDINNDGTNDFVFVNYRGTRAPIFYFLYASGLHAGNNILATGSQAAALPSGAKIGSSRSFAGKASMAFGEFGSYFGNWANTENRYLGLEFSLNGQEHFGWAEFSVLAGPGITGTLEGYAYDSVPNQSLLAGQTSATPEPGTLGLLALGSLGLAFWRKRKSPFSNQASE